MSDLWFACVSQVEARGACREPCGLYSGLHRPLGSVLMTDCWRLGRSRGGQCRGRHTGRHLASFHSLSPGLVFFLDLLKEVKQHLCPSTLQETERSRIFLYWSIIYFGMPRHVGLEGVFRFGDECPLGPLLHCSVGGETQPAFQGYLTNENTFPRPFLSLSSGGFYKGFYYDHKLVLLM